MPFYEYVCKSCGQGCEFLQSLSDPPATECPKCGEHSLVKQISAAGFRLKGGGWYETDFKSDGKRNLAGDSSPEGAKTSDVTAAAGSTDTKSKPAATTSDTAAAKTAPKAKSDKASTSGSTSTS